MTAPVALFAYNRPELLRRTLAALAANDLACETELVVYSDGAKNPADRARVDDVRRVLDEAETFGFKRMERHDREKNRGLADSVIQGVGETVERFGRAIVLEDDLEPGRYFLKYMNDALERYENDGRVCAAHAHYPASADGLPNTFFLRGANCWGWAVWRRAWKLFEPDGAKLLAVLKRDRALRKKFDCGGAYPFFEMLASQVRGDTESWAIRWYASTFLAGKLALNPNCRLVVHTGGNCGTHFFPGARDPEVGVSPCSAPVKVELIPVEESVLAAQRIALYRKNLDTRTPAQKILDGIRDAARRLTPRPLLLNYRKWRQQWKDGDA